MQTITIGLISTSDRASSGVYADEGIPALKSWLGSAVKNPIRFVEALIPDEQAEIEAAIDTVESAALREILTQHYICALDLKEIAERMHYSDRHMRRLHRKAIESVSLSAVSPFKKRGSSPRALPLVKRI